MMWVFSFSLLSILFQCIAALPRPQHQQLSTTIRTVDPVNIEATFTIVAAKPNCPGKITHEDIAIRTENGGALWIRHDDILHDDIPCTGEGVTAIVDAARLEDAPSNASRLLQTQPTISIVQSLGGARGVGDIYIGYESNSARECGNSQGDGFPLLSTLAFFNRPDAIEAGTLPGVDQRLEPNRLYMVVYESASDDNPCVFVGGPSTATASATPSVDGDGSGEGEGEGEGNGQNGGGIGVVGGGTPGSGDVAASPEVEGTVGPEGEPGESPGAAGDGDDDDDDDDICFSADATVVVKDAGVKKMEELNIGDQVLVHVQDSMEGETDKEYSPVFMFTHRQKNTVNEFVRIETESGRALSLTKGHYLYINGRMAAASTVSKGDLLQTSEGKSSRVTEVSKVRARGLYNPQTLHGDVYVDGIRSSTYTTSVEPQLAHNLLMPLRALFKVTRMDATMGFFDNGASTLAKMVPRGQTAY